MRNRAAAVGEEVRSLGRKQFRQDSPEFQQAKQAELATIETRAAALRSPNACAARWEAAERDPSFLLRGSRLDQVRSWADSTSLAISDTERAYVDQSAEAQDAAQARERAEEMRLARAQVREAGGQVREAFSAASRRATIGPTEASSEEGAPEPRGIRRLWPRS